MLVFFTNMLGHRPLPYNPNDDTWRIRANPKSFVYP
jgi:hypothetical protein